MRLAKLTLLWIPNKLAPTRVRSAKHCWRYTSSRFVWKYLVAGHSERWVSCKTGCRLLNVVCVCVQAEGSPPRYDDLYTKGNLIITVAVSDCTEDISRAFKSHVLEQNSNSVWTKWHNVACRCNKKTCARTTHMYTLFNVFEHVCNQEIFVFRPLHVHLWQNKNLLWHKLNTAVFTTPGFINPCFCTDRVTPLSRSVS